MRKPPEPRSSRYFGMKSEPLRSGETWLEPEEIIYPHGRMVRRARVRCADGKLRIVRCGIPDTFFSIPVRGGGYISVKDDEFFFHAPNEPVPPAPKLAGDYDAVPEE